MQAIQALPCWPSAAMCWPWPSVSGYSGPPAPPRKAGQPAPCHPGLLADGEPLHQSLLAERLKVSPIPLREALRLLETEGLVDFRGRRGAVVTGLSAGETREIYEMLAAGPAAGRGARTVA